MKSEILVIAEAILANTQVLKMLVEKLPAAAQSQVAAVVEQVAPVTTVPAQSTPVTVPVVAAAPVVTPVTAPVVAAPIVTPVTVTIGNVGSPFNSAKELMDYVMLAYKALGSEKGAKIQEVLNSIGCTAINEVRPDQYAALHAGIEALKA